MPKSPTSERLAQKSTISPVLGLSEDKDNREIADQITEPTKHESPAVRASSSVTVPGNKRDSVTAPFTSDQAPQEPANTLRDSLILKRKDNLDKFQSYINQQNEKLQSQRETPTSSPIKRSGVRTESQNHTPRNIVEKFDRVAQLAKLMVMITRGALACINRFHRHYLATTSTKRTIVSQYCSLFRI